MGIVTSGMGVGILVFSVATGYLLTTFEWRWTLRLFAAASLLCMVCGLVYEPLSFDDQNDNQSNNARSKYRNKSRNKYNNVCVSCCPGFLAECFPKDTMKNPILALMCLQMFCFFYSYLVPYQYIPVRAQHLGVSEMNSSYLISSAGLSTILCRLTFGLFGNFAISYNLVTLKLMHGNLSLFNIVVTI